jgi:hypothetical protein
MKVTKAIAKLLVPVLLLTFGSGCATPALWSNTRMDACNQPAATPNVRLFSTSERNDFLVVYDEYSGHARTSSPRAYWLEQNDKRIAQDHRPLFVSPKLAARMMPVPVLSSLPDASNAPPPIYAVVSAPSGSFTLYRHEKITTYRLPEYDDGRGTAEKIFLTPPAVIFDSAIVCAYAAAIYYSHK